MGRWVVGWELERGSNATVEQNWHLGRLCFHHHLAIYFCDYLIQRDLVLGPTCVGSNSSLNVVALAYIQVA